MINLNDAIFGNTIEAWLIALGIALSINLVAGVAKFVAISRLSVIAKRTTTSLDDALVETVRQTRQLLIFFVTLYIGCRSLEVPERFDTVLKTAAVVAAFLQAGLWGSALLNFWIGLTRSRRIERDVSTATGLAAIGFIARALLWVVIGLLLLDNLGVDVTALVAGLGIGGIAVALALQNILGDLFASLSIVIDKPFVLGDFIIVDDYMGTVEHVGLKTTRVRSLSGEQLVFSNNDLLKARLRNYKRMNERRIVFGFGVLYQTTAEQLEKIPGIVSGIIKQEPLARIDRAHFKGFGDSSLDFEVVYWMRDPDFNKYMDTQQSINLALFRTFAKENIGFAYPTRTLYVEGPVQLKSQPANSAYAEG